MTRHWGRVFSDYHYARNWVFYVGASTSSWWFVFLYGGHYGGTISADIERRRLNGRKLGAVMTGIKFIGDRLIGREHWGRAYFNESLWLHLTHKDPSKRKP